MKHIICSIKDRALDAFMPLFTVRTEQQAIRAFTDALRNPQEQMAQHPEDYDLYVIGFFNDQNGYIDEVAHSATSINEPTLPRKIGDGKNISAQLQKG